VTRYATGGQLHGLSGALSAVNAALDDLSGWAVTLTEQMNAVHMASRDANGDPGGRLFSLNGWAGDPAPANRGTSIVNISEVEGETPPSGGIRLVRADGARFVDGL